MMPSSSRRLSQTVDRVRHRSDSERLPGRSCSVYSHAGEFAKRRQVLPGALDPSLSAYVAISSSRRCRAPLAVVVARGASRPAGRRAPARPCLVACARARMYSY